MSDVNALREALRESRVRLFDPIQGLSEEQFRHMADGAEWNIATHLAHLLRCERMLVERSSRALREDEPAVRSTGITNNDDAGLAQRLAVPQIIHGMQASRRGRLDDDATQFPPGESLDAFSITVIGGAGKRSSWPPTFGRQTGPATRLIPRRAAAAPPGSSERR